MPALIGLLVGAGLDLGGMGLGIAGAQDSTNAENSTAQNQINMMKGFQRQAQPWLQQSMLGFTPQQANMDITQGQQQFLNADNAATGLSPGFASPLNQTNSAVSKARAGLNNTAQSNYAGYSNLPQQWNLQNAQSWPRLGLINDQAANQQALYPTLLNMASRHGQGLSSLGQLLGGLGSLTMASGGVLNGAPSTGGGNSLSGYSGNYNSLMNNPQVNSGAWAPFAGGN
jgi:hypothetical protein